MKPRLLDLFCGAGGCSMGYHRAGFDVVGVDINPQPRYPFTFYQRDALDVLREMVDEGGGRFTLAGMGVGWSRLRFDAIHASPPCQGYSVANNIHQREDHPLLIDDVRSLLAATELPYVIENVEGAKAHMRNPVTICGLSLGLNVRRHRLFECSFPVMTYPCGRHEGDWLLVFGHTVLERSGQVDRNTPSGGPRFRRKHVGTDRGREAMGIDWMNRDELSEAIPPAYTEHIGGYLLAEIKARREAAA